MWETGRGELPLTKRETGPGQVCGRSVLATASREQESSTQFQQELVSSTGCYLTIKGSLHFSSWIQRTTASESPGIPVKNADYRSRLRPTNSDSVG